MASYANDHAKGRTAILFIRRAEEPDAPYYTLELNEKTLTVRQNHGLRNCAPPEEVREFAAAWLDWLKKGGKRDKPGNPKIPRKRKGAAA